MPTIRRADERGHVNHGWLDTYHTFSFASFRDPKQMGFRTLRVINEDFVEPEHGFMPHDHTDMEIITYVLEGALEHKDSMGNGSVIRPNDVQKMTAGRGVTHSEFNHSKTERVHLLQIWIFPNQRGLEPSYEQKTFSEAEKLNRLRLIASPDRADGSVIIYQDVRLYASILEPGKKLTYKIGENRYLWIQLVRGEITVNGKALSAGDGASVSQAKPLEITATQKAEFLFFDLA